VGLEEPPADSGYSDAVRSFASRCRTRYQRLGGLVGVLAQAAATEPFVADAVTEAHAANRRAAAELVRARLSSGSMGRGVDPEQAAETVAVLSAAEAWLALSEWAGWDADRYETWLAETITVVLRG
jgi:hypothetical protein